MNGQMKNFNIDEVMEKDKLAKEFIESVNPYRLKQSIGIDLVLLSRYAKKNNKSIKMMSEDELSKFRISLNQI